VCVQSVAATTSICGRRRRKQSTSAKVTLARRGLFRRSGCRVDTTNCLICRRVYTSQADVLRRTRACRQRYVTDETENHFFVTHIYPLNGPLSGTTRVSWYQKGKTNLDFTEGRDSEWQWHQLGHMQVCTSLLTDNHASNPPLSSLQAGCPSSAQPTASKH